MRIIRTHSGKEVKIFAETFENEAYDQIKSWLIILPMKTLLYE